MASSTEIPLFRRKIVYGIYQSLNIATHISNTLDVHYMWCGRLNMSPPSKVFRKVFNFENRKNSVFPVSSILRLNPSVDGISVFFLINLVYDELSVKKETRDL